MNSEQLPALLAVINPRIIGMLMDSRKLDNKRAGNQRDCDGERTKQPGTCYNFWGKQLP
jgi:hypothetical protein